MNHKGFILAELLVSICIIALVSISAGAAVFSLLRGAGGNSDHMTVIKQVENATYWMKRDSQMAQTLQLGTGSGFPLNISWVAWDNTTYQVYYTLANGKLHRSYVINGGEPNQTVVANYISDNAEMTNCQYVDGIFSFKVTALISGFKPVSETRVALVIPRPA